MSEIRDSVYKGLLGGGITLAVCLLAVVGYLTFFGGPERSAINACKEAVERDLKAPGTAEWVDVEANGGDGAYTVTGSVDSENSFGASVRSSFSCETVNDEVLDRSVSGQ